MRDTGKIYRRLFIISFLFNIAICSYVIYRHYSNIRLHALALKKEPYWMHRNELFKMLPMENDEIIFLGNSLTEQFPLTELFGNLKIKNRGINGDDTKGVLNRLDDVTKSKPKKIFIELGVNDIGLHVPLDTICANYEKILRVIQLQTPQTQVFVQSLLPVRERNAMYGNINSPVKKLNGRLIELCTRYHVDYINLYDSFLTDNELNPAYTIDGMHLSGEGYLLWKKLIEKRVEE